MSKSMSIGIRSGKIICNIENAYVIKVIVVMYIGNSSLSRRANVVADICGTEARGVANRREVCVKLLK